jgi:hypothetical protein
VVAPGSRIPAASSLGAPAMRFVIGTRGRPSLIYAFNLCALGELKHVVCMFFSVNNPQFKRHLPDLVKINLF